jgi:hypothetical protein
MVNKKRTSKKKKRSYVKLCDVYAEDTFIDTLCIGEGFRFLSSGKNCSQEELDELVEDRILQFVKCHKEKQKLYTKEEANRQEKHLRELEGNFEEITEELFGDNGAKPYQIGSKAYQISDRHILVIEGSPTDLVGEKMYLVKRRLYKMCILCGCTSNPATIGNSTVLAETSPTMIKRAIKKHVLGESK